MQKFVTTNNTIISIKSDPYDGYGFEYKLNYYKDTVMWAIKTVRGWEVRY